MDTTQANTSNLDNLKTSSSRNGMILNLLNIVIVIVMHLIHTWVFSLDEEKPALPLLSESLVLDNLWETLSACLLELEYTPDHHAVLVLQVKIYISHFSSSLKFCCHRFIIS